MGASEVEGSCNPFDELRRLKGTMLEYECRPGQRRPPAAEKKGFAEMSASRRHTRRGSIASIAAIAILLVGAPDPPISQARTPTADVAGRWIAPPTEKPQPEEEASTAPKLLTPAQINRIRFMELRGMRLRTDRPDAVTVKIPRETIEEFLESLKGDPGFSNHRRTRREFMKLTPAQKLHQIAVRKGDDWADKVEIKSDPEVFKTFKRKVMPTVLRTCAAAGCHTSTNEELVRFRLYKDPKRTVATTYTNFITLDSHELTTEGDDGDVTRVLIDRESPADSLLLCYMLPPDDVKPELRHPGDVRFKPAFTSRGSTVYKNVIRWIGSLRRPSDGYGLNDEKKAEPKDADPPGDPGDKRRREPGG